MAKLIQQLKSLFCNEEKLPSKVKLSKDRTAKKKVKKKPCKNDIEVSLKQIKEGVEENGYYSITVGALFKRFGFQKRHLSNIVGVIKTLEKESLYITPGITLSTGWNDSIQIHSFPVSVTGDHFKSELEMENLFKQHKWYEKLNLIIEEGDRQFKPKGTRDRLDFKARDKNGNLVVLELKHMSGDKRVVEQAFRYRSLLKTNFPDDKVKCVIITGNKCIHTARAIHGLCPKKQKKIKWYVYEWYRNNKEEISFIPVTIEDINNRFTPQKAKVTVAQDVQ